MLLVQRALLLTLLAISSFACGVNRGGFDVPSVEAGSGPDVMVIDAGVGSDVLSDVPSDVFRCPGMGAEVSGTVFAPNGEDPVPGAVVYLTRTAPSAQPMGVACDNCDLPGNLLGYAVSNIQGRFLIPHGIDGGGTVFLVVQKGRFRRVTMITGNGCNPVAAVPAATTLPGARAQGELPRILVAAGSTMAQETRPAAMDWSYDDISRVIRRIGITEFDTAAPCRTATVATDVTTAACEFGNILADAGRLAQYNVIFAPCGSLGFSKSWQVLGTNANSRIATNVREWLQRGGRLYASDTAYGLLARSAPSVATFAGGMTLSSNSRDPANIGMGASPPMGATYQANIVDPNLRTWLTDRGVAAGTVPLTGFISPWVAVDSVPMTTRVVVDGEVNWFTGMAGGSMPAGRRPLSISADIKENNGCGRVLFSSYEVDNRAAMDMTPLSPQERILEYLLFELGGCINTPG